MRVALTEMLGADDGRLSRFDDAERRGLEAQGNR